MVLTTNPWLDPAAVVLAASELEARFLPTFGMLGVSLRCKGLEILRRLDDLETAAAKGSTAGIPFLFPWANRLAGPRYEAVGKSVTLDPASPLLHFDDNGLPMHGVPWSHLAWEVLEATQNSLIAGLDWSSAERLAVFPYAHRLTMTASLQSSGLNIATTLHAGSDGPVPVSFGFHPYFGLSDLPRADWLLGLPAMRRLALDPRGIPTGSETAFDGLATPLGDRAFDDGYALLGDHATFSISGSGQRICVEFIEGFTHAQVFAPIGKDFIALEPMTAPANAMISGEGLRLVAPGDTFRATFCIRVSPVA